MFAVPSSVTIAIQEICPTKFASLCNEAHAAMRGKLADYLHQVVEENRGVLLAAHDPAGTPVGRVCVEINPCYVTHGRPCATFGWLDGDCPEVVRALLDYASEWASRQEVVVNGHARRNALLRGPISLPKALGGIGCQVEGFHARRMSGESANRPELGRWIEAAGFRQDAPYACMDVTGTPVWKSARDELEGFTLVNLTAGEWYQREAEVVALAKDAFGVFLPDTLLGRFPEMLETASEFNSFYLWPAALDRANKLAGFILALPNAWDAWDGEQVTSVNVDTVIISPRFRGSGIFSALHNKGIVDTRATLRNPYIEGTTIWCANENAVRTIFPHGTLVRKHIVFQKRLPK